MKYIALVILAALCGCSIGGSASRKAYKVGPVVYTAPRGWKISGIANHKKGLMVCIYNNQSRHDSKILLNGVIYEGRDETIGMPVKDGNQLVAIGENGRVHFIDDNGQVTHGPSTTFATAAAILGGKAVYSDQLDGKPPTLKRASDGSVISQMGGNGIVNQIAVDGSAWVCAISEGNKTGFAFSDGSFVATSKAFGVVRIGGKFIGAVNNQIGYVAKGGFDAFATIACEKITHLNVLKDGRVWLATSAPDKVGYLDGKSFKEVGSINDGSTGMFDARVIDGYWARSAGDTGQVLALLAGEG